MKPVSRAMKNLSWLVMAAALTYLSSAGTGACGGSRGNAKPVDTTNDPGTELVGEDADVNAQSDEPDLDAPIDTAIQCEPKCPEGKGCLSGECIDLPPRSPVVFNVVVEEDHWPQVSLYGVWGSGPDNIHAVGSQSGWCPCPAKAYRFDGNEWEELYIDWGSVPYDPNLGDVWGVGPEEVYAIGSYGFDDVPGGVILKYTGAKWVVEKTTAQSLGGVWAAPNGDVFVVGRGVIYRKSGGAWSETLMPGKDFRDVWGLASDQVFAVGFMINSDENGWVFRFDGGQWVNETPKDSRRMVSIWGTSKNDLWAVALSDNCGGDCSDILRFDGKSWTEFASIGTAGAIRGIDASNIFVAAEDDVYYMDGKGWNKVAINPKSYNGWTYDLWGTDIGQVWGVGSGIITSTPCTESVEVGCHNDIVFRLDTCGQGVAPLEDCKDLGGCLDGKCKGCEPHTDKTCWANDVYWKNSCGKLEEIAEDCPETKECKFNKCIDCTPHKSKKCSDGNVFWVDACDKREEMAEDCPPGVACEQGLCCLKEAKKGCNNQDVYWYDACGVLGAMFEDCTGGKKCSNGACKTCTSKAKKGCSQGDVYWFDSCGYVEVKVQDCSGDSICKNGACVIQQPPGCKVECQAVPGSSGICYLLGADCPTDTTKTLTGCTYNGGTQHCTCTFWGVGTCKF